MIDEVIAEAGDTKSGFFYRFKDKNTLAHEMLRRYVATNDQPFDEIFARKLKEMETRSRRWGNAGGPAGRKAGGMIQEGEDTCAGFSSCHSCRYQA